MAGINDLGMNLHFYCVYLILESTLNRLITIAPVVASGHLSASLVLVSMPLDLLYS